MFKNKALKYSLSAGLIASTMFFAGCSSKEPSYRVSSSEINKIYKYNPNKNIRNSKAMHRATLRPYEVFGVKYYPRIANIGDDFTGIASWYGPNFHAKKTSNGETYNMYAMTAAHKTLPMNTMLRVLNLENGKSTIVRINDRGPFVDGRIIDLSNSAAHKIDMVRKGTVKVKITVLGYNGEIENSNAPHEQMPVTKVASNTSSNIGQKVEALAPVQIEEKIISESKSIEKAEPIVAAGKYNIQVGAFGRVEGAIQTKEKYESLTNGKYNIVVKKVLSGGRYLHKVLIQGFDSYNHAQLFKDTNSLNGLILGN